jgi:hypothetical protein
MFGLLIAAALPGRAATFIVTTTNDSGPGSLRQAITDANGHAGTDIIVFNITNVTASPVKTITVSSALSGIVDPVIIDGYTQPGSSSNTLANADDAKLLVEISGAPTTGAGLLINSLGSGSTIRGLVINGFNDGIDLFAGNCVIEGNFLGTDPTGTLARTNFGHGIQISGDNNRIGGTNSAARNILSGNTLMGIFAGSSSSNLIQGNFIGADATGTNGLGNGSEGIRITGGGATGNLIGGATVAARNIVSSNVADGISITFGPFGNVVRGNYVGTDASGTRRLGNHDGIQISGNGSNAVIANVVCGNWQHGVIVDGELEIHSVVQGNLIGVDATGTNALGNVYDGVAIGTASGTTVGGTNAGLKNIIAHNGAIGVDVYYNVAINNAILGNAIFDNGALGIDLQAAGGFTANDLGDTDEGPNHLQNFPVLTGAARFEGLVSVSGTLNSSNNASFRLEFFGNASCDSSGHGEGERFLTFTNVVTDGSGNASFTLTFPDASSSYITATATDVNGNTSEFSACAPVSELHFTSISTAAGNVVMRGIGGPTNATYYVLTSTDAVLPLANWASLLTNQFDAGGNFVFTNAMAVPARFYRLSVP